jgi:hypothetical protein
MDVRRLDGNSAAGILQEVFRLEVTGASTTCAACGAVEPLGALHVYPDAPGVVLRCLHCTQVMLRIVASGGRYWLDASGTRCLELRDSSS